MRRRSVRAHDDLLRARAAGIALGFAADRLLGDPRRGHPVAVFGRVAGALERAWLDSADARRSAGRDRAAGVVYTGVLVGGMTTSAVVLDRASRSSPVAHAAWTAATVWACLGGSSLLRIGRRQADLLGDGDVDRSRDLLPWLCGRDPALLDEPGLARAVVESLAENTSDASVGTLVYAAVAGAPGAVAHRAANTLDAMVGHHSERYEDFGWAPARLDDLLGLVPARLAGLLGVAGAPLVGGSAAGAWRVWRRDAARHPSPNAGVVEAVCAGALGVRLGGPTPYPYGMQNRAVLGDGREVRAADVRRAVALQDLVQVAALVAAVGAVRFMRRSAR